MTLFFSLVEICFGGLDRKGYTKIYEISVINKFSLEKLVFFGVIRSFAAYLLHLKVVCIDS
eukprot:snap_masked-scaffold_49-processed-gene-1.31-mRNA-1 protein AED:1.00 eAED:1.00 QI:0/0/0/0/1/1/3/0/60